MELQVVSRWMYDWKSKACTNVVNEELMMFRLEGGDRGINTFAKTTRRITLGMNGIGPKLHLL